MNPASYSPEDLVRIYTLEFSMNDRKRWSSALEWLVRARTDEPARYEKYLSSIDGYLPQEPVNITGFATEGLNVAQKWLQLFALDVFVDEMIITHYTFEDWLIAWEQVFQFAVAGFDAIVARPDIVNVRTVDTSWTELRAALS